MYNIRNINAPHRDKERADNERILNMLRNAPYDNTKRNSNILAKLFNEAVPLDFTKWDCGMSKPEKVISDAVITYMKNNAEVVQKSILQTIKLSGIGVENIKNISFTSSGYMGYTVTIDAKNNQKYYLKLTAKDLKVNDKLSKNRPTSLDRANVREAAINGGQCLALAGKLGLAVPETCAFENDKFHVAISADVSNITAPRKKEDINDSLYNVDDPEKKLHTLLTLQQNYNIINDVLVDGGIHNVVQQKKYNNKNKFAFYDVLAPNTANNIAGSLVALRQFSRNGDMLIEAKNVNIHRKPLAKIITHMQMNKGDIDNILSSLNVDDDSRKLKLYLTKQMENMLLDYKILATYKIWSIDSNNNVLLNLLKTNNYDAIRAEFQKQYADRPDIVQMANAALQQDYNIEEKITRKIADGRNINDIFANRTTPPEFNSMYEKLKNNPNVTNCFHAAPYCQAIVDMKDRIVQKVKLDDVDVFAKPELPVKNGDIHRQAAPLKFQNLFQKPNINIPSGQAAFFQRQNDLLSKRNFKSVGNNTAAFLEKINTGKIDKDQNGLH
jgi:hypothetical protein